MVKAFVDQTGACLCKKKKKNREEKKKKKEGEKNSLQSTQVLRVRQDKFFNHVKMIYLNVKACHLTSFHFSNCLCFFWMINLSSDSLNMTN